MEKKLRAIKNIYHAVQDTNSFYKIYRDRKENFQIRWRQGEEVRKNKKEMDSSLKSR